MPQSVLDRGSDTTLSIGAWESNPALADLNQALIDNEVITEGFVTTLSVGTRNSLLHRGPNTRLYIGAFQHPDPQPNINELSLVDNLAPTESIVFTSTPTKYPHDGLLNRGSAEDTINKRGLEIGAWQTPFPRLAGIMPFVPAVPEMGIMPFVPEVTSGLVIRGPFDFGWLQFFELLIDDITEIIPYKIQVIAGDAADAFPDAFIPFDFYTKHVLITVWDNPIDVTLTRHGSENFYAVIEDFGFLKRLAVRGYKIRNTTPGLVARYQLIALG